MVPAELDTPFGHAYGYLEPGAEMESHAHPAREIDLVYSGSGFLTVGEETEAVGPGDVAAIPPDAPHTMRAGDEPLLWAALWWD